MDLTDSRLRAMARQDATSVEQNADFFARDTHGRDAAELDPYWPAALTPARAVLIVGRKRAADV